MSAPAALAISKLSYPETEESVDASNDYSKMEKPLVNINVLFILFILLGKVLNKLRILTEGDNLIQVPSYMYSTYWYM